MSYEVNLQLIKSKRQSKGYTLQEMAQKLGLKGKPEYYRREIGESKFKSNEIPMISNILDIDLEKIFTPSVEKIETK